jgi:hypothetical protein
MMRLLEPTSYHEPGLRQDVADKLEERARVRRSHPTQAPTWVQEGVMRAGVNAARLTLIAAKEDAAASSLLCHAADGRVSLTRPRLAMMVQPLEWPNPRTAPGTAPFVLPQHLRHTRPMQPCRFALHADRRDAPGRNRTWELALRRRALYSLSKPSRIVGSATCAQRFGGGAWR